MGGGWATLAFLIFGFIILAYLLLQIYDRLRHDARQQPAESPQLRLGVNELVHELRQAADQINADMTARANTLQKLVDDANEALKRLDGAAQRATAPAQQRRSNAPRHRPVAAMAAPAGEPAGGARERTAGGERRVVAAAEPSPPRPTPSRATTPTRPPPRPAPIPADGQWPGAPAGAPTVQVPRVAAASPAAANAYRQSSGADPFVGVDLTDTGRFQTVRRLADQGMAAADIARTIGLGREEVELIMRVSGEVAS